MATKKAVKKRVLCGVETAQGDRCTLEATPHKLHACWLSWDRGIRVWGPREVVEAQQ